MVRCDQNYGSFISPLSYNAECWIIFNRENGKGLQVPVSGMVDE